MFVTKKSALLPYTEETMALDDPLVLSRKEGKSPGTVVLHITGPVTLRNLFHFQEQLRSGDLPRIVILDLAGVPYMDSAGMGAIINYFVHCGHKDVRLIVAGVNNRVMELFKMTRVDKVLTLAPNAEEAEAGL
jgi:anti-sigma B factor antagonist